jgi:hypothetical protein
LVWLYWQIGHRLRTEFLKDGRAEYGKRIIHTVAISLTQEFGRGFGQQLSWTHLRELLSIEDPLKRRFYTELCCLERWSTRTRTAIAQRPTSVIDESLATLESGNWQPRTLFSEIRISWTSWECLLATASRSWKRQSSESLSSFSSFIAP